MKRAMFVVFSLLLTPSLFADASSRLIPAGALVSCTTGDGKISSKTTAVGDPVLCKVQFRRGDFMLPYGSYLGGQFLLATCEASRTHKTLLEKLCELRMIFIEIRSRGGSLCESV